MYGFLIIIHVIAAIVLIAVILLQAGKGGGLSETFGGGTTRTIFGTKANTFLTRATSVCAVVFLMTCLVLAIGSTRRGRSLMEQGSYKKSFAPQAMPLSTKTQGPGIKDAAHESKNISDTKVSQTQNLPEGQTKEVSSSSQPVSKDAETKQKNPQQSTQSLPLPTTENVSTPSSTK